jgi:hypothetical protein
MVSVVTTLLNNSLSGTSFHVEDKTLLVRRIESVKDSENQMTTLKILTMKKGFYDMTFFFSFDSLFGEDFRNPLCQDAVLNLYINRSPRV